jgi:hypothetical protein
MDDLTPGVSGDGARRNNLERAGGGGEMGEGRDGTWGVGEGAMGDKKQK